MQSRMDAMQAQTAALSARLQEVEQHKAMLLGQLTQMRDKWSAAVNENVRLQHEVSCGSGPLEVRIVLKATDLQWSTCVDPPPDSCVFCTSWPAVLGGGAASQR